ncbi:glycosyltransferase [Shewanella mangrovisoli]|uniref:glycosyltransferase n=1 Tax=Shewanella mangrovisoli TaxID=2864211 RepID=UPI0035B6CA13
MNITLIITCLGMGGAQRQVCDLADEFIKSGHQVQLIVINDDVLVKPKSHEVQVAALNMTKTPLSFVKAYWQARRLIKQFKPDVVHSHMVHANLFARLLRLTTRMKKLICTAHSSNEGGLGRMLAYRLTDALCNLSTNVSQEAVYISVSRGAVPASCIIAMPNGIDTLRFTFNAASRASLRSQLQLTDNTPLILAVGRFTEAKDYPNLLTAFKQLPNELSHTQLAIIGTGEEQASIEALVVQLGLTDRVHFLGLQRNVHQWMSSADVFVLSSAWEGFGLVVAEAMACERVVVATDCGGVKEVLGDCGLLVPPKDSEKLANALTDALSWDANASRQLGIKARQYIQGKYSLSTIAKKWLELYQ